MSKSILGFYFLFQAFTIHAQNSPNLYALENRKKYADHLLKIREYSKAADECKEIWQKFNLPEYAIKTSQCYRALGNFEINEVFTQSTGPIKELKFECEVMNQLNGFKGTKLLNESKYGKDTLEALSLSEKLFKNKYKDAAKEYKHYQSSYIQKNEWENTISLANKYKPLSPLLAGTLSTFLPGLGKIYSGRTIDGVMGFISVASFGYLAYEGFRYKKYKSIAAWIYAPLTVGFYVGNIYGSIKAAKTRNKEKQHLIHESTQKILLEHLL